LKKHGKYCKDYHHFCECGAELSPLATQCKPCYDKIRHEEQLERIKTFVCKDCGKPVCRKTVTHGKGRCESCATKNAFKENPILLKKLSQTAKTRLKNPENNGMFGKKHTEEAKRKMSDTRIKKGSTKGENNGNWQGGIWDNPYSSKFNNSLKAQIRYRDNNECQICSKSAKQEITEINHELAVHHIDYNKQNCAETNLVTLCNKCHMKTNFNRDYWFAYFNYIMEEVYV
jgi:hypothetical protein